MVNHEKTRNCLVAALEELAEDGSVRDFSRAFARLQRHIMTNCDDEGLSTAIRRANAEIMSRLTSDLRTVNGLSKPKI